MLYSEGSSSASAKQWVAIVVAHELAHQVLIILFVVIVVNIFVVMVVALVGPSGFHHFVFVVVCSTFCCHGCPSGFHHFVFVIVCSTFLLSWLLLLLSLL